MIFPIDAMKPNYTASLACDTAADVSDLPQYTEKHHLGAGSTCLVKSTGDVYMQDSTGAWGKIGG